MVGNEGRQPFEGSGQTPATGDNPAGESPPTPELLAADQPPFGTIAYSSEGVPLPEAVLGLAMPAAKRLAVEPSPIHRLPAAAMAPRREPATDVQERMRVENVWLAYGETWVVRDVTLPIRRGEVLALIGGSGSGKTTLLRSLNRLTEMDPSTRRAGSITLDDQEVYDLESTELRQRIGMVFQEPNPFPMSIRDNVVYGPQEAARRDRGKLFKREALQKLAEASLQRAGLYEEVRDRLNDLALHLSGGQKQRLCIARALAAEPEVLLLDEPCSALDPESTRLIEELILELRDTIAIVIVTHNLGQARLVADQVAFMHNGELVEYGTREQVFENPQDPRTRDYVQGVFG